MSDAHTVGPYATRFPRPDRWSPASASTGASQHHVMPGGGLIVETWQSPSDVTIGLIGTFDARDENALIDLLTGCLLEGARYVVIDGADVTFLDERALDAFARVHRFLQHRQHGYLSVVNFPLSASQNRSASVRRR